ncbi:unnamed protein product (mitochondrion) [Plasmodiophora brassicae]|uniref:Uncharacterized protein n=1 Tax=Plasmodiophora brassicae TaxID=37360 RepID=A0A0G4J8D4_PLABS|nr:hypothetical protein PBRA_003374 [Plasmodiophora brassicae]SPQ99723.1 unnamed protein product [Plasmodiophora brassicae]
MNGIVSYASDSDDDAVVERQPPLVRSVSTTAHVPAADKVGVEGHASQDRAASIAPALAALPPPKKSGRKRKLAAERTRQERDDANGQSVESAAAAVPSSDAKNGDDAPRLLIGEEQGPAPPPPLLPPEQLIPEVRLDGRVVRPPPGLKPPPTLFSYLHTQSQPSTLSATGPESEYAFEAQMSKGRFIDITANDLRKHLWSRPDGGTDPLASQREMPAAAASIWNAKQNAILTTSKVQWQASRRHHISNMASSASVMEDQIRARAAQGADRRKLAKAKYGW